MVTYYDNNNAYFTGKKKVNESMKTDLGTIDVRQLEDQITYPGQAEFNLRNVSYSPSEVELLYPYKEDK